MNRREAIRKTVFFSSALLAARCLGGMCAHDAEPIIEKGGMHLLAFGDFGTANAEQEQVARRMATFARELDQPLAAVLALGDNFYGRCSRDRFRTGFEEMYDPRILSCPFYACLGNHDYDTIGRKNSALTKADVQLAYARNNPGSRWKMPAKWYVAELPDKAGRPLVRMIYLDGNRSQLGEELFGEQTRFLERELTKEIRTPWTWVVNHYPMFTAGTKRGDNPALQREWGSLIRENNVSLFLSGHDHNLQHLQVAGYDTSFLVSGGGGRSLDEVKEHERGFSHSGLGFHHLRVDEDSITVQIIGGDGERLHAFRRSLDGKVVVL